MYVVSFLYIAHLFAQLIQSIDYNATSVEEDNNKPRIVGGVSCNIEDRPFMVSIKKRMTYLHVCGGSLVHKRWVMTAGHCVYQNAYSPSEYVAIAGLTNKYERPHKVQTRKIVHIAIHPDFDPHRLYNDIALMAIRKPFSPNQKVNYINLPQPNTMIENDIADYCPKEKLTVSGWGYLSMRHPDDHSNFDDYNIPLQCLDLPLIGNKQCNKLLVADRRRYAVISVQFCMLNKEGGQDACQGDSGGPVTCNRTQYGIVSGGFGCAYPNLPGFYTRVDAYMDFIRKHLDNPIIPVSRSSHLYSLSVVPLFLACLLFAYPIEF